MKEIKSNMILVNCLLSVGAILYQLLRQEIPSVLLELGESQIGIAISPRIKVQKVFKTQD